jgi:mycothiol maleylpyruvate isomerase-like protein
MDRSFVAENRRELERMRKIAQGLDESELASPAYEGWTVAGVLGHIAFWDERSRGLAERLHGGGTFSPADEEPEDVDWINDAARPLIQAIPPRALAELALRIARETDASVERLPDDALPKLWPADPHSPLNPVRAGHRGEHLDQIEKALASRS